MNDDKPLTDYRVVGGSVLHLVLALRGGNSFKHLFWFIRTPKTSATRYRYNV